MAVIDVTAESVMLKDVTLKAGQWAVVFDPATKVIKSYIEGENPPGRYARVGTIGTNTILVGTKAELDAEIISRALITP